MSVPPSDPTGPGPKPSFLTWLLQLGLATFFATGILIAYLVDPIQPVTPAKSASGSPGEAMVPAARLDSVQQRIAELEAQVVLLRERPLPSPASPTMGETSAIPEVQTQVGASPSLRLLTSLGVRNQERGLIVVLGEQTLQFAPGKASLPDKRPPSLDQLKSLLDQEPLMEFLIEGNTDNRGQAAANQTLSSKRAEAVKSALIDLGADPKRIRVQGLGATRPVADNRTPEGRSSNRRIEIHLQKTGH